MKLLRRFAVFSISSLVILALTGMILGYVFKDKLHVMAIQELEKVLDADIQLESTDVSFLKSFPRVAIDLERLSLDTKESQSETPFIQIEEATLQVDLFSFFSDQYEVLGIDLYRPEVLLARDTKGKWNYGSLFKAKGKKEGAAPSKVMLALRSGGIQRGSFTYSDLRGGEYIEIHDINLDVSGGMEGKIATLDLGGDIFMKELNSGGTTYLKDRKLGLTTHLVMDVAEKVKMTFSKGEITADALAIGINGVLNEQSKSDFFMDFAFASNRNSFDSFLSVIPGGLLDTGEEYEYTGDFRMEGYLRGVTSKNSDPEFYADFSVKDGTFRYTDFETQLSDVNLNGNLLWNSKKVNQSGIRVENMQAKLNQHRVTGKMEYTNFDRGNLDFEVAGDIDLADLQEFYPRFAAGTELSGHVTLDLLAKGRTSDFQKAKYNHFKAEGQLELDGVTVREKHLKYPIENLSGHISLNNTRAEVSPLSGTIGDSDFKLNGNFSSYLPYFLDSTGTLVAKLDLVSKHLDLNQLLQEDEKDAQTGEETYRLELPKRLDFTLAADIDDLRLQDLEAKNLAGNIHLTSKDVDLSALSFEAFGGKTKINGQLKAVSDKQLNTVMRLNWENLDINQTLRTFGQWGDFTLLDDKMYGRSSGNVDLKGSVNDRLELDEPSLEAKGHVEVQDGKLKDYEPLNALAGFVKLDKLRDAQFSDIQTDFQISKAHFIVPDLAVTAMDYNLQIKGRHGFDSSLDYYLKIEMPKLIARKTTNPRIAEYVDETEGEGENLKVILPIRIKGTVDDPSFSVDGKHVKQSIAKGLTQEKEEIKEGFHEEVNQIFGEQDTTDVNDWIEVQDDSEGENNDLKDLFQNFKNPFKRKGKKRKAEKPQP